MKGRVLPDYPGPSPAAYRQIAADPRPLPSDLWKPSRAFPVTTEHIRYAVKKSRYAEEQIANALKQAETGIPVAEVLRRMGIGNRRFCHDSASGGAGFWRPIGDWIETVAAG